MSRSITHSFSFCPFSFFSLGVMLLLTFSLAACPTASGAANFAVFDPLESLKNTSITAISSTDKELSLEELISFGDLERALEMIDRRLAETDDKDLRDGLLFLRARVLVELGRKEEGIKALKLMSNANGQFDLGAKLDADAKRDLRASKVWAERLKARHGELPEFDESLEEFASRLDIAVAHDKTLAGNSKEAATRSEIRLEQSSDAKSRNAQASSRLDSLPFKRLQFKASHNSYECDEKIVEQLAFNASSPSEAGCRGVEFDCIQDKSRVGGKDEWRWMVKHEGDFSADEKSLAQYLDDVRRFADAHPGHDPIDVHIELKDAAGADSIFALKFDELIIKHLAGGNKARLFTPADMMKRGFGVDLVAVASNIGWPSLKEMRGKFFVVITGNEAGAGGARKKYYAKNPRERIAFVDQDCGEGNIGNRPNPDHGDRLFLNVHVYQKYTDWQEFCHWASSHKGFIVRAWKVNAEALWTRCLIHGVNILATDKVKHHSWAKVGTGPYRQIMIYK
jgi:hypothetical protein